MPDRFDNVKSEQGRVGVHRAEHPRMHGGVVLLWSLVSAALLTVLGILLVLLMMQTRSEPEAASSPTPSATEAVAPPADVNYEIFILNTTADEGRGTAMKAEIESLGWAPERVHLPIANEQDFPRTVLVYASESDAAYAGYLAGKLGIETVEQSEEYAGYATEPELHPLVIVLGADSE